METGTSKHFEEYNTLRQEMLELQSYCRQITYWTIVFVIAGLGWYLGKRPAAIDVYLFAGFLLVILVASAIIYYTYTTQAFRIGSFIAVFWESREPTGRLFWHRFNRNGASSGTPLFPKGATFVYALTTALILFFSIFTARPFDLYPDGVMILVHISVIIVVVFLMRRLETGRKKAEKEWKAIKESLDLQNKIHNFYEAPRKLKPPSSIRSRSSTSESARTPTWTSDAYFLALPAETTEP